MSTVQVYLTTDLGVRIALLDQFMELEYTRVVNDIGTLRGTWSQQIFDPAWLHEDYRVEVWRAALAGGPKRLDTVGLLRYWNPKTTGMVGTVEIVAPDYNEILARRIVAYADGSAQADKTDEADDFMKEIVRDNMGADCVDTARDLTTWGLSVVADEALGPSVEKKFSRRVVLDAIRELAETATTNGTPVYFELAPLTSTTCEFRTWINQPGVDRTADVLVGLEYGNLKDPSYEYDAMDELTYIYAGGQGEGAGRNIQAASDTARIGASAINRREGWADASVADTDAGVQTEADAALEAGKPRRFLGGTLVETPGCLYGRDWYFGDRVTAVYGGQQYACLVKAVTVRITSTDGEQITADLEVI